MADRQNTDPQIAQRRIRQLKARWTQRHRLLLSLGYRSYKHYLHSKHWRVVVQRAWRNQQMPQQCEVCGAEKYQLHHWSYQHLGQEQHHLEDLQALCQEHHSEYHRAERLGEDPWKTLAGSAMRRRQIATCQDTLSRKELLRWLIS